MSAGSLLWRSVSSPLGPTDTSLAWLSSCFPHHSYHYNTELEVIHQCDSPVLTLAEALQVTEPMRNRQPGEGSPVFQAVTHLLRPICSWPSAMGRQLWLPLAHSWERLEICHYCPSPHCSSGADSSGGFSLKRPQGVRQGERSDRSVGC